MFTAIKKHMIFFGVPVILFSSMNFEICNHHFTQNTFFLANSLAQISTIKKGECPRSFLSLQF